MAAEPPVDKSKGRLKILKIFAVISLILVVLSCLFYYASVIIHYAGYGSYVFWSALFYCSFDHFPKYLIGLFTACICLVAAGLPIKPGTRKLLNAVCICIFAAQIIGMGIYTIYSYHQLLAKSNLDYFYIAFYLIPDFTNGYGLLVFSDIRNVIEYGETVSIIAAFMGKTSALYGALSNLICALSMVIFNRKIK